MQTAEPQPYEVYKGINLYVTQNTQDEADVQVSFDWYGRIQTAEVEEYERPTLANQLRAAKSTIDILLLLKGEGHVSKQGYIKESDQQSGQKGEPHS